MSVQLDPIERAAVLRVVRNQLERMRTDLECMTRMANLGDKVSEAAAEALHTEIELIESAVKKLWLGQPP